MTSTKTHLHGCFILQPKVFEDERGYFLENFNQTAFNELIGASISFVQDNQSLSTKGVLRGLHYQIGTYAQSKLVWVVKGKVLDVVVDLRKDSKSFGEHFSCELSEENKKQLYIPKGFAHGFVVLSDSALFCYKCDNYYNKSSEGGIIYNDKKLDIDWKLPKDQLIISEKDKVLPIFENAIL